MSSLTPPADLYFIQMPENNIADILNIFNNILKHKDAEIKKLHEKNDHLVFILLKQLEKKT